MLRSFLITISLLLLSSAHLLACSCDGPETFCQTISPFRASPDFNTSVFSGRPIGKRTIFVSGLTTPLVDVVVTEVLLGAGIMAGDTVALIGQDGLNCGIQLDLVNDSLEQIFGVFGEWQPADGSEYLYSHQELLDCGVTLLQIRGDMVYGPIAGGVDSLGYADFVNDEDYCIAGPIPEGCSCTTQVVDFCDEVAAMDQRGLDFGIVRLRQLFNILPAYDSVGFPVSLGSAVITEVLLGDEFVAGDTVAVVQRDNRGCVEWNFSTDALWAYTEVDYEGVNYTSRFNDYPRLAAEGCSQNTEEIVNDSVVTLAGLVAYADYLEDLKACVPALSTVNLGDAIDLQVYPNPATEKLLVSWQQASVNQLQLVDLTGRVVLSERINPMQSTSTLTLNEVPAGIYFLRLSVSGEVATRKVVVR